VSVGVMKDYTKVKLRDLQVSYTQTSYMSVDCSLSESRGHKDVTCTLYFCNSFHVTVYNEKIKRDLNTNICVWV
jgi:hypothetical protein